VPVTELTDYLATLSGPTRDAVAHVYERARTLVPEAIDGVGYGMPALVLDGRPLVSVMVARTHIGLYPFSSAAIDPVRDELGGFSTSKGTVRFSSQRPVPDAVLDRIVLARRDEIRSRPMRSPRVG